MNLGWQDILVLATCLAAGTYVARALWLSVAARKSSGCGSGCGKCATSRPKTVLTIEPADLAKIDP